MRRPPSAAVGPQCVVLAHNFYRQAGGEDMVFQAEAALLEANGHQVERFVYDNADVDESRALASAAHAVWNRQAATELRALLRRTGARVVHFHNTFPLMSPSVYYAARLENAAIVQTLHNFRLACIQGFFFRDGRRCEKCLHSPLGAAAVLHRCYRGSLPASAVATGMIQAHRLAGTWRRLPHRYIALSAFGRMKMIEAGLPSDRIVVKPNFVTSDPGVGTGDGGYAIYVGRLSPEKGLNILLTTWTQHYPGIPLKLVGDGPLLNEVRHMAGRSEQVTVLGRRPHREAMELVRHAIVAIVPSQGVEPFGLTVIEALACGTPVVASRIAPLSELVSHDRTGYLFTADDPAELSCQVKKVILNRPRLKIEARSEYVTKYTADANYKQMIDIYRDAMFTANDISSHSDAD